jgi:hypothetical protein
VITLVVPKVIATIPLAINVATCDKISMFESILQVLADVSVRWR